MLDLISLIPHDWRYVLKNDLEEPYFFDLMRFLSQRYSDSVIFPKMNQIFAALEYTHFNDVRVVIIGQDPYPTQGHAEGLAFSTSSQPLPRSLQNIFKELASDLGVERTNGSLIDWASQGVLLLNSVLTVESGMANSHAGKGWEIFTDSIIRAVDVYHKNIVFLLWGAAAKNKAKTIDLTKHVVINTAHPSPLSAYRGFFGSRPFSRINQILDNPIDWLGYQGH